MNLRKLCSIVAVLVLSTSMVRADLLWTWSYTTLNAGGDYTYVGSGYLTTTDTTVTSNYFNDFYQVTSISGTWEINSTTYTITGLAPFDGGPQGSNDNLLGLSTTGISQLDSTGVAFFDSNSDPLLQAQDIRYETGEYQGYTGYNIPGSGSQVLHGDNYGWFTATLIGPVVPEPATDGAALAVLLLLGIGLRRFGRIRSA